MQHLEKFDWDSFMTLKCHQCSFENSNNAEKCESCGTIFNNTIEISQLVDKQTTVQKQDSPMHDSSEIEVKLDETKVVLPLEEEGVSSANEVDDEIGNAVEATATNEVEISDEELIQEAVSNTELDNTADESIEASDNNTVVNLSDDETLATAKMPHLDDEDGLLHIGSVRFRGNLLLTEKDTGTVHRIENEQLDEALIGRLDLKTGFRPQIDFTNADGKELGVSRRHATINQRGDLIFVTDHNSLNGTYLNGQRLVPEQARVMRDSDSLRIGHVTLIVSFEEVLKG